MAEPTIRPDVVVDKPTLGNVEAFDPMAEYLKKHADKADDSSSLKPQDKVRPREADETEDTGDEGDNTNQDTDQSDTDTDETSDDDNKETKASGKIADDDAEVIGLVDGKEVRSSVKDLKRLLGQEASLTRKAQEVASVRKATDEVHQKYAMAIQKQAEEAKKAFEPYANIDWVVAGQKLGPEEIVALREEQTKRWQAYKYFTEELDATHKERHQRFQQEMMQQGVECVKKLRDPESPFHIDNWTLETYQSVRGYAVEQGIEPEIVETIVDPAAVKILYKAMMYDKGKDVATKKIAKASPTKTLKSKDAPVSNQGKARKALDKLVSTGGKDLDDVAAAYLARMNE